jgi:disulfide bond formation protein DsbB
MYEDDFDDAPPRRMQPGTKVALGIIGASLFGILIVGIVSLAHHSASHEPATQAARAKRPAPRPTYSPPRHQSEAENRPSAAAQEVDASAAASAMFLGLSMAFLIGLALLSVLIVVAQILILVWVVKDARARGADGGVWLIVILLAPIIGLLVYLASRPPGLLVPCSHCGNRRLDYLRSCPICGRDNPMNTNVSPTWS